MFTTKNLFTLAGKHFLIALVAILLASSIVVFLSNQITNISEKAAKNHSLARSLSEKATLVSTVKNEAAIIGKNDEIIESAFIPSNNILSFVSALESLALKNGVTQTFHFSSPTTPAISTIFPLSIIRYQNVISANVTTLINYLKDFENLPYFTQINSINISSSGDWKAGATVSIDATIAAKTIQ